MRAPELSFRCPLRWEDLESDRRLGRRFCPQCAQAVHDVSAMSRSGADRFLREHPEACIRFQSDCAGRLVTKTVHLLVLSAAVATGGCAHRASPAPSCAVPPEHPETPAEATLSAEVEDAGLTPRPAFSPPGRTPISRHAWRYRGGGGYTMGR